MPPARIAVLASGSGTLLQAILREGLPVTLVAADRPCRALDIAAAHGVAAELVERTEWGASFDRARYTARLVAVLRAHDVDLVVMAGFGTVVPALADAYAGRVLNSHPALLPAFKGWHPVRDALAAGVAVTGTTIHVATAEVDDGPILAQEAVPVLPGDTEESLHERIKQVERRLYPRTIRRFLGGEERTTQEGTMRALLSVYDKSGVVALSRGLAELGWDLVSSGGTAAALRDAGVPVTDTAEVTGVPAILGHRVMTLHPRVHGGILADRSDPAHRADMEAHGIEPFDLVVVNLYPFGTDPQAFEHGAERDEELIDIGGPAMIRAAAKNHAQVGVVVDPAQYEPVLDELRAKGGLSDDTRRSLARTAFARTAAYDAAIVRWFDATTPAAGPGGELPDSVHVAFWREPLALRYGENPHQRAALYRADGAAPWWSAMTQHGGLALSYLNLYDADAAWLMAHDLAATFGRPAAVIVKHANPCGAAVDDTLADAYQRAFEGDERSAFGGIVALTEPVDAATAERMVAAAQADVVIAPGYAPGVVEALAAKRKNTRVIEAPAPVPDARHRRPITGGLLLQEPHRFAAGRADWRVATQRQPTEAEWADAELAWRVCGWVRSNAIVLVKDGAAWGIGAGQQNRVEAGQLAAGKAAGRARGGACASDAFYPFPDGIDAAAEAGVAVVIQPGGSVSDAQTIARADELGLAMVLTGERHFLH